MQSSKYMCWRSTMKFLVARNETGLISPVHVQKHLTNQQFMCENSDCYDIMVSAVSYNPSFECHHLGDVKHAHVPESQTLHESSLDELLDLKIISNCTKSMCKKLHQVSLLQNCPLVAATEFYELEYSSRQRYYSVFTIKKKYFSKLLRVRVTFDCTTGLLSCKCPVSGPNRSCIH